MNSVFIIHGSAQYRQLFESLGYSIAEHLPEANLVCFTGGEDVDPYFYGDRKHNATWSNRTRDEYEMKLFAQARELNIPCVGICRGGQFLNVMGGGRMYQDVTSHALYDGHIITDCETGEQVYVSSTHHQMMMPGSKAIIVATAALGGDREWYDGGHFKRDTSNTDYEVLYYPETNSLCFQPHPEFGAPDYVGMRQYFDNLLRKYLGQ